ncbi:Clavaminate synthase-like protein [Lactarius hengduanensis]|nr:Clavaminate synthase-like protein [Lactarius hengduanensis]
MAGYVFALRSTNHRALLLRSRNLASLASDVRSDQTFRIPLKRKTADEVVNGFKEVGFIYLEGHGIPSSTVDGVFRKVRIFQTRVSFDKLAWEDPRSNRGYVKIGREHAAEIAELRKKAPDSKETMEIGYDWDETWKNQWPQEGDAPGFKQTTLSFFQTCHELHTIVMRSIAVGLDLDEMYFEDKINEQQHNLRLLSYPSIKSSLLLKEGQARAGAHSDYGTLTLLFQDNVGGLEVENPHTKHFQPAKPIPGTIVVNAGDLLSRWTNDVLRSTLHRVVAPPIQSANGDSMTPARQSIAFFCNPNAKVEVSCLPNCHWPGNEAKYAPVRADEYLVGRLAETYE